MDTEKIQTMDEFLVYLSDDSPLQNIYDDLHEAMEQLSLLQDTTERADFIKIIVSFVGYIESNLNKRDMFHTSMGCSSTKDHYNETCVLLAIPNESKNFSSYSISNITFYAVPGWSRKPTDLITNISVFDCTKALQDMKIIYKSDRITVPATDTTDENWKDKDKGYIVKVKNINVNVKCGQLYLFWIDVQDGGNFNFGLTEEKNCKITKHLFAGKFDENFAYNINDYRKTIAFEFC